MYYFAILEMYSLSLVSTITDRLVGFSGGPFWGSGVAVLYTVGYV